MKYICIHHKTKETRNCETCCGATTLCGKYENALGIDPFFTDQPTAHEIIEDARRRKIRYPQPHNIKIPLENIALEGHLILKEHGRLKYAAKYLRSKQSKRNYGSKK